MAEKKNYYAIIPAPIRYDKQLKDKAKMLYGEVTALANELGYCYASNAYFADLYGVRKETISRLLSDLQQKQYIRIELIYQGKEIKERRIYISENQCLLPNKSTPYDQKVNTPIDLKVKDNNTSFNNTFNNTYEESRRSQKFVKPTVDEIKAYCEERNNGIDAQQFYDFYESKGWMIGKTKMKDWKASVRTWEHRSKIWGQDSKKSNDKSNDANSKINKSSTQRSYTKEELDALVDDITKIEF